MQWFECWFNTPYYHLLYGKRNEEEAAFFLDNLLAHLKLQQGARCWDLNCGKGRHAMYLNKKGFDVIGTDLSTENIACAKQSENDSLHFYTHDMRGLFYANYFDAVFNLFTSFGYFKHRYDDEKVLRAVANSLKEGGFFVMDFFNADHVLKNLVPLEEKNVCDTLFTIKRKKENGFIVKEIHVEEKDRSCDYREEVRAFTLPELEEMAKKAGLRTREVFGNYALQPFDVAVSERLILIFTK